MIKGQVAGLLVCGLTFFPLNLCLGDVLDDSQPNATQFPIDPLGCEFAESKAVRNEGDEVCAFLCGLESSANFASGIDEAIKLQFCTLSEESTLHCSIAEGSVLLVSELEPVFGSKLYVADARIQELFRSWSDGIMSCSGFVGTTELLVSEPQYLVAMNFRYTDDTLKGILTLAWDDAHSSIGLTLSK